MINLFEYQNKIKFDGDFESLEIFLDEIWNKREKSDFFRNGNIWTDDKKSEVQRFIQFIGKSKELKSNKYVGVIHFDDCKINLLPKIFYNKEKTPSKAEVNIFQTHILWWLSYCRKIKFPNYLSSLGSQKSDFFEILIYLFSKYTRTLLSSSIYRQYEEVNRELNFVKGRININAYIRENLAKGKQHKISCTFDAFVMDNQFNRIVKYVATTLFNVTKDSDNKKYLREILFILDEVKDTRPTVEECTNIKFNPMFGEFETVRDYCLLFLRNSISVNYKNDLKLFAFLLPMEYVFEDFIFGFIAKEMNHINANPQVSQQYLTEDNIFRLRPDLILTTRHKKVIADTKYKIIYADSDDPKRGISQSDLYQMIAYAIRFKVKDIILFYPNTCENNPLVEASFLIKDRLAEDEKISIHAYQLPVINFDLIRQPDMSGKSLSDLFDLSLKTLLARLSAII